MSYAAITRTIEALLAQPVELGRERLPGAGADHRRLIPAIRSEVAAYARSPEESKRHNRELREALLRIASIECAAGAPVDRCRQWFACLGALAAWTPPGAAAPVSSSDAAMWLALAGRYVDPGLRSWPEDPDTAAASERAIYRLYARKPVELPSSELHDDELWSELVTAVERRNAAAATATFVAIADWWLEEYQATGTEAYDPENFSTFEPAPNAALAIALHMGMDIRLPGDERRRFYYVALMPVEDQQP